MRKVLHSLLVLAALAILTNSALGQPVGSRVAGSARGGGRGGIANSITLMNKSGAGIGSFPFQFGRPFLDGAVPAGNCPTVLLNGAAVGGQTDVKNRYPDGTAEFAVMAVVVPQLPANRAVRLTFGSGACHNTPLTRAQMLAANYNFDAGLTMAAASGTAASFSGDAWNARTMLTNGDYKLWTSGPVAQTIMLADDTTARKYDIGLGGRYHPLRPRYYATFWPATNQVFVRAVVESANPQEVEDTSYVGTLTGGATAPTTEFTATLNGSSNSKIHWGLTSWTQRFWLGGTPSPRVDIDYNLAYLESTRYFPNYDTTDPATAPSAATLTAQYANWTGKPQTIYDGVWDGFYNGWANSMSDPGSRPDIGPWPAWYTYAFYSPGDWRMRQIMLGMADLATAWPYHLRESVAGKNLLRSDAAGAGTAMGLPFSIVSRPTFASVSGDLQAGQPADDVVFTGPFAAGNAQPWQFSYSHSPAPFAAPYILTGDPFYLGEATMWAAWEAAGFSGTPASPGNLTSTCQYCRGPDGTYGGIAGPQRGSAWVLRNRAEAAFLQPDGSLEKTYLQTLVDDAEAGWEGEFGITGTPFAGTPMYAWRALVGNSYNGVPAGATPAAWSKWDSTCINGTATTCPAVPAGTVILGGNIATATATVNAQAEPWVQAYMQYALGRAVELGFAAEPVAKWTGQWIIGAINDSGYPALIAAYSLPSGTTTDPNGLVQSWAEEVALIAPSSLSGMLANMNARQIKADGYATYPMSGIAMQVDEGAPGAARAWSWMRANVYTPEITSTVQSMPWNTNPSWLIVPRTDTNALPAQPTGLR
jgi:hypothetical protein